MSRNRTFAGRLILSSISQSTCTPYFARKQHMPKFPDALSTEARIKIAETRADKLIDHVRDLYTMHEANKIVIYSKTLSSQIPRSRAALAFNQMQRSMHLFELIRLCALWDPCGDDRESAPTVVDLINTPEIIRKIVDDRYAKFASEPFPHDLSPTTDPTLQKLKDRWWEEERLKRADEEAGRTHVQLINAISHVEAVRASPALKSMRNFRDQHIAHNLNPDRPTGGGRRPRYGEERILLRETVKVADLLHRALNDTSFMWLDARRQARRAARALWTRCTFDVAPSD